VSKLLSLKFEHWNLHIRKVLYSQGKDKKTAGASSPSSRDCVRFVFLKHVPGTNQLHKKERLILAYGFRLWTVGPIRSGATVKQNFMAGWMAGETCLSYHLQKHKQRLEEASVSPLWTCPQWPNFLTLCPTSYRFHHLPIASWTGIQDFGMWAFGDNQNLNNWVAGTTYLWNEIAQLLLST
jgi:hypothetical protein